jgi:hypothetical protein
MEIIFYFLFFVLTELIIERGGYAIGWIVLRFTNVEAMPRSEEVQPTSILKAIFSKSVLREIDGRRYLAKDFVVLLGWSTVAVVGIAVYWLL